MFDIKWPARDKGVSEDVAKRNGAENHCCIASLLIEAPKAISSVLTALHR
jgi:hypothetical protein